MGAVFRAVDPSGREVALKAMSAGGSELALKRFLRETEAQSAAGEHPNVLTIYGSGHDLGCPWIAVQLAGESLQERIDRYGALDAEEVLRIGEGLARGLAHVHERGILHRDLKPENVLFSSEDEPLIADFGVARVKGSERLTQTGQLVGTLSYMSPEQLDDRSSMDERTDVYGLGAILYHCLSGLPPFDGPMHEVMRDVAMRAPSAPSVHAPRVPVEIERVVLKAMAKSPDDRWVTMSELAEVLARLRRGESLDTSRRPLAILAALVTLALVGGALALAARGQSGEAGGGGTQASAPAARPPLRLEPAPLPATTYAATLPLVLHLNDDARQVVITRSAASEERPLRKVLRPRDELDLRYELPLAPLENQITIEVIGVASAQLARLERRVTRQQRYTAPEVTCWRDGSRLVRIPAGTFPMGAYEGRTGTYGIDEERRRQLRQREAHPHEVTLTRDFYIGLQEISWGQYLRFCAETKRPRPELSFLYDKYDDPQGSPRTLRFTIDPEDPEHLALPVNTISWEDASEYCDWAGLRLPTEAEWSYAARGAKGRVHPWGEPVPKANLARDPRANLTTQVALDTYDGLAPVGSCPRGRSPFGLFNCAGNVREYVQDRYGPLPRTPQRDPEGPAEGRLRVQCGGDYQSGMQSLVTFERRGVQPNGRNNSSGFRVARRAD
ncbi:MAG TPA: hypothetical protein DEA08_23365 [Planctomycetes bacterium]|nr:hypothetical protein [Planctomycetota bacterium]